MYGFPALGLGSTPTGIGFPTMGGGSGFPDLSGVAGMIEAGTGLLDALGLSADRPASSGSSYSAAELAALLGIGATDEPAAPSSSSFVSPELVLVSALGLASFGLLFWALT